MGGDDEPVSAFDAAAYIHQIAREMAGMAQRTGLTRLAEALVLAEGLASDALLRVDSSQPGLAPDEAA